MMRSRGVNYLLTSPRCARVLLVSVDSLRKHYDGNVTIFATDDSRECAAIVADQYRCAVRSIPPIDTFPNSVSYKHYQYTLVKTAINLWTDYDSTVFLDADTIVLGPIDALFDVELGFVARGMLLDESSAATRMRRAIKRLRYCSPVVEPLSQRTIVADIPWVNSGVYTFASNHPAIREWFYLTMGLAAYRVHEELTFTLLIPDWKEDITFLDPAWNAVHTSGYWFKAIIRHYPDKRWHRCGTWRRAWQQCNLELREAVRAASARAAETRTARTQNTGTA